MSFNSLRLHPWSRALQLHAQLRTEQLQPDVAQHNRERGARRKAPDCNNEYIIMNVEEASVMKISFECCGDFHVCRHSCLILGAHVASHTSLVFDGIH